MNPLTLRVTLPDLFSVYTKNGGNCNGTARRSLVTIHTFFGNDRLAGKENFQK